MEIERVHELDLAGEIDVASTAPSVRFAVDGEGREWVAKLPLMGDSEILAEAVSWLLAIAIDAPTVRAAAIWRAPDDGALWWLGAYVERASHWTPGRIIDSLELARLGALLALDTVVWNIDRHERNLLVDEGSDRIVGIDFGAAAIGVPPVLASHGTEAPPLGQVADGVLDRASVRGGIVSGAARLAALSPSRLTSIARQGCGACDASEYASGLADILVDRCGAAESMVKTRFAI